MSGFISQSYQCHQCNTHWWFVFALCTNRKEKWLFYGLIGFNISGFAFVDERSIHYSVTMTWNDIIDPNPRYLLDTVAAGIDHALYNPKDYVIRISWDDNFTIPVP